MARIIPIPVGPIYTGGACGGIVHVVERGDTLYQLGKRYHVSVGQLMFANPFVNVYNLQIGDELCIPVSMPRNQEEMQQRGTVPGEMQQRGTIPGEMQQREMQQRGTMPGEMQQRRMTPEEMQQREMSLEEEWQRRKRQNGMTSEEIQEEVLNEAPEEMQEELREPESSEEMRSERPKEEFGQEI